MKEFFKNFIRISTTSLIGLMILIGIYQLVLYNPIIGTFTGIVVLSLISAALETFKT
jgi:hypothetical protein